MHWKAPVRGLCSGRCTMGHGRCRPYYTTAQRLAMRSVPHDGDVVFSTDATGRPAVATGPARESNEHLRRFAEAEKVAPASEQPVLHHPGIQECPDEFQQPLVLDALGDLAHQFVVIDSIEELFQIKIDHPSVA